MKMKITLIPLILMLAVSPLREVENVKLSFPTQQQEIFIDYSNDNFSQELVYYSRGKNIRAEIKCSNYLQLDLHFRVVPGKEFIAKQFPELRAVILDLLDGSDGSLSMKNYMTNISFFLEGNIRYSEENLPQDAASVMINKKANCVGFSNLVKVFLDAGGIENRLIKGFYLKEGKKNTLMPVPHRWVEIRLSDGIKFFYDPQYQRFSANYIITRDDVDFKTVRKFKVTMIHKSKIIID
jgi:transglutaminase-like putative cysteine protease